MHTEHATLTSFTGKRTAMLGTSTAAPLRGHLNGSGTAMANTPHVHLTRRERQIMDGIYERGAATVAEVLAYLPDAPSYSAVRAMLRKLEEKGHLAHEERGPRYVYRPTLSREAAQESAVRRLVRTFFEGSPTKTVAAILDSSATELSREELDELSALVEQARKRGR